ncbi:hypothetical protein DJ533_09405 [Acinetobacter defluvii]|uniref:TFIIB-type zinc ribbon-containing protein n=1 Tax=Acinetobacter defluvii TaxID=1871111 RepID=A0A2S2FCV1_9GAMM|nr:hypothetical protein [Acinetobacter defluvii]AWL28769.1 hypothetical protein DJ533_09405 [Acinetobacter defluvii]
MALLILQKEHDESSFCPLCKASMFIVSAELNDEPVEYFECTHCEHKISDSSLIHCTCQTCSNALLEQKTTSPQNKKVLNVRNLSSLYLIDKLFLFAILDKISNNDYFQNEFINFEKIKWEKVTATYSLQSTILYRLEKYNVITKKKMVTLKDNDNDFYLNIRVDRFLEPSLYAIHQKLKQWFFEDFKFGAPFQQAEEVHSTLFIIFYHEILEFTQYYCKRLGVKFSGNKKFKEYCYYLLNYLSLGQIYYMVQTALDYLSEQKNALDSLNTDFNNTNKLRKTLEEYRKNSITRKFEISTLPRPYDLYFSRVSEIFLFHLIKLDENYVAQTIPSIWQNIKPRMEFFSKFNCMYCGSTDLIVEYDDNQSISTFCNCCKHQDHYFTK